LPDSLSSSPWRMASLLVVLRAILLRAAAFVSCMLPAVRQTRDESVMGSDFSSAHRYFASATGPIPSSRDQGHRMLLHASMVAR
jgi:hypothetical protein